MTKDVFDHGQQWISATFPNHALNSKLYWHLLKDLSDTQYERGVKMTCILTEQVYPGSNLIATIRQYGLDVDLPKAAEAWGEVQKYVMSHGHLKMPTFSNTLILNAVRCIGWHTICIDSNTVSTRARFIEAYKEISQKTERKLLIGEIQERDVFIKLEEKK